MAIRRTGEGFARLKVALKELDGVTAKTGWFETEHYPDGTPVAYVAAIQEFGAMVGTKAAASAYQSGDAPGRPVTFIPPRPFMRPTVAEQGDKWVAQLGEGAKDVLAGKSTASKVMEKVAIGAAGDIAKTIRKVTEPPLAKSTIARKGFSKPLIDSGQMARSVTGVVEKK